MLAEKSQYDLNKNHWEHHWKICSTTLEDWFDQSLVDQIRYFRRSSTGKWPCIQCKWYHCKWVMVVMDLVVKVKLDKDFNIKNLGTLCSFFENYSDRVKRMNLLYPSIRNYILELLMETRMLGSRPIKKSY